jgi:hypothetical protein
MVVVDLATRGQAREGGVIEERRREREEGGDAEWMDEDEARG